ncbi:MAG: class I SAM-dependent methyltransferase [Verrucomicrobiota bacterium]
MLFDYYNKRAQEYERIYAKPERQDALGKLKTHLQKILRGNDVLEIACGTGYWTEVIASTARSVLAMDISEEMLSIARQKSYSSNNVNFALSDAYALCRCQIIR